jgi:hypothetical protein
VQPVLDQPRRVLVHDLHRGRHDAAGDRRRHRATRRRDPSKSNSIVFTACGRGIRRTQISVMIASVPSLPVTTASRSASGASSASPPSVTTLPSYSTATSPSTWFSVTPYFRQCGPPAFVATLPPMVLTCCDAGSGA